MEINETLDELKTAILTLGEDTNAENGIAARRAALRATAGMSNAGEWIDRLSNAFALIQLASASGGLAVQYQDECLTIVDELRKARLH